ncbi:unnamed protein product [Vitrella brassicaformis CCMP3155]|uniref:Sulfhydryl oxidase n=1 Tax=Vitrella brassicaformis (strain CCMP3155) TaxID=1169540 RepID=A0A0G4GAS0_VITBC|nr:unnamed protein product [Vitrella brassicaformis CCMP3155]|eukprot:CEM26116.1 unnamed protein product [Vitrella brassicaformis CCMP3155]
MGNESSRGSADAVATPSTSTSPGESASASSPAAPQTRSESSRESDAAAASASASADGSPQARADKKPSVPVMHFCEFTNKPTDLCNAQWLLLWTFAAYTDERPSEQQQRDSAVFFRYFPDQCTEGPAAKCYKEAVKQFPPRVSTRHELMMWLCMIENQCRKKAGVPLRTCRYNQMLKRWRYPDGYL